MTTHDAAAPDAPMHDASMHDAPMHDAPTRDDGGAALARALADAGVPCRVESHGRLAVLAVRDPAPLADPVTRRRVSALAAARGFTHVALELDPDTDEREALRSA